MTAQRGQVAQVHAPYPVADDRSPATMPRRLAASLIDLGILLLLGGWLVPLARIQDDARLAAVGGLLVVVVTLVQWVLHGRTGWTVGRLATGIRTLDVDSRLPVGALRVLVRGLVLLAGVLALGVGLLVVLLSPLLDRTGRRRGWHDLAARDEVLDVRPVRGRPTAVDAVPPRRVGPAEPVPLRPPRPAVSVPDWAVAGT
ncbi:RDD family protein, partial [uncultured Cellulomonas sp.]|uniref:RDD family protein n=1 Tax=uncultured Cellulomonas sp. TaxID=189682 RepID=UPI0028EDB710